MSPPRLPRALAASAAVHVALLGGLLALAHPRLPASPAMRVALVATAGPSVPLPGGPGPDGPGLHPAPVSAPASASAATAAPEPPSRTSPPRSAARAARRSEAPEGTDPEGSAETSRVVALVTPVQSDVWLLGAPAEDTPVPPSRRAVPGARPSPTPAPGGAGPPAAASAPGGVATGASPAGDAASGPGVGGASQGGGAASLLAALSQRLAWSAERCAPASVVHAARRVVPGVPLHFCLDAAGRPSEVGLLGTTGSEQLDRAARDCVVPGALPLPPVPGCYTVEVRFPTRG